MPKQNKQKSSSKTRFSTLAAVAILALTVTLVNTVVARHQNQQIKQLQNQVTAQRIAGVINEDLNRLSPAPSDGKLYIPEQHLVLPVPSSDISGPLAYRLFTALKGDTSDMQLVSLHDLWVAENKLMNIQTKDMKDVFAAVPRAQACGRGISMQFSKDSRTPAYAKQLKDGRTIYLYTETECQNDALFALARQIDSY